MKLAMTVSVKTIDVQRWVCRTSPFESKKTSYPRFSCGECRASLKTDGGDGM
jgi:hypothetical protein